MCMYVCVLTVVSLLCVLVCLYEGMDVTYVCTWEYLVCVELYACTCGCYVYVSL